MKLYTMMGTCTLLILEVDYNRMPDARESIRMQVCFLKSLVGHSEIQAAGLDSVKLFLCSYKVPGPTQFSVGVLQKRKCPMLIMFLDIFI